MGDNDHLHQADDDRGIDEISGKTDPLPGADRPEDVVRLDEKLLDDESGKYRRDKARPRAADETRQQYRRKEAEEGKAGESVAGGKPQKKGQANEGNGQRIGKTRPVTQPIRGTQQIHSRPLLTAPRLIRRAESAVTL